MSDEFSLRGDMEQDLQDTKDGLNKATQPLQNKVNETLQDEIQERIQKQIAEQAAKNAAQTAAETAATSGAGGMAAAETADAIATTGGGASTAAAAETAAGAGTTVAAGEATIAAEGAAAGAGATVAEGAAAGSAGGPVGAIVGVVVGVVIAAASAIKKATDVSLDKNDPNGPKFNMITIIIAAAAFGLVTVCGTLLSKGTASSLSIGQETEFQNTKVDGNNMAPAGDQYQEGTVTETFNDKQPLANTIKVFTLGPDETSNTEGIRGTLDKALRNHCQTMIAQLEKYKGTVNGKKYDEERSLSSFYENPWPYDLATPTKVPKIGDVFLPGSTYYDIYYEGWNPRYDDVNYAEILSIMGMSANAPAGATYGLHWGELNYNDFMAYLQKEECYKYMYELGLSWVPVYKGTKTIEESDGEGNTVSRTVEVEKDGDEYPSADACSGAPETIVEDGATLTFSEYYVKVKVKPFGLRELFAMAFNTTDPWGASEQMHVDFDQHTNRYMLDYQERVTRLYERGQKTTFSVNGVKVGEQDSLGPSYKLPRSQYSSIYYDLIDQMGEATGRSAWYYIADTYNDAMVGIVWTPNPGIHEPIEGDWFEVEGGKQLNMFKYINQGWYPDMKRGGTSSTVGKAGCYDCSIAMIIMYYLQQDVPIEDISYKFVDSQANLNAVNALAAYGLKIKDKDTNFQQGVINAIDAGHPAVIHIQGHWESSVEPGRVLHKSDKGHFLVAVGYNETGVLVYDPGSQNNTNNVIPYEDWARVSGLYIREVYP